MIFTHTHDKRPIRAVVHCTVNESARQFVRSRSVYVVIHHSFRVGIFNTEENIEQIFCASKKKANHILLMIRSINIHWYRKLYEEKKNESSH